MTTKNFRLLLLALICAGLLFSTAWADAPSTVPTHTVTLEGRTVGEGKVLSYTTVSAQFAESKLPEGVYAGALTLDLTGPIVVEEGGTLSIGTLSIGNPLEASPLIRATLSPTPLIVVKSGGSLMLTDVVVETSGAGLLILQEPGASISLTDTQLPQELVQWAPPTVDNRHDVPDDIWLEVGTPLTLSHLPSTLTSTLQYQGQAEQVELPLCWDFTGYDGRTAGSLSLTGSFLDETGTPISSTLPLTITVHWYEPEELVVTDVDWKGNAACSAHFTLLSLPDQAQVVGEISTDGGETWTVWPQFDLTRSNLGSVVGNFYEVSSTPQHYRLVASAPWSPISWVSESFLLPQETEEDAGGNRGGSITPVTPDREPTPPQPSQKPAPVQENTIPSAPTPAPSWPTGGSAQLEAVIQPQPEETPVSESAPTPAVTAQPEPSPSPAPTTTPQPSAPHQPTTPSNATQVALVAAGILLCVGCGIWVARRQ